MVRWSRVCVPVMPLCPPSVLRSRQLLSHDGGNTLQYQDHGEELRTLPLNSGECELFNSLVGQCRSRERQSSEPMALQVEGGNGRAMPRLVRDALGDEAAMREREHRLGHDEMGEPEGVRIVDETGVAKTGQDSVGVARPSGGSLGKAAHGHAGGGPPMPRATAPPASTPGS